MLGQGTNDAEADYHTGLFSSVVFEMDNKDLIISHGYSFDKITVKKWSYPYKSAPEVYPKLDNIKVILPFIGNKFVIFNGLIVKVVNSITMEATVFHYGDSVLPLKDGTIMIYDGAMRGAEISIYDGEDTSERKKK